MCCLFRVRRIVDAAVLRNPNEFAMSDFQHRLVKRVTEIRKEFEVILADLSEAIREVTIFGALCTLELCVVGLETKNGSFFSVVPASTPVPRRDRVVVHVPTLHQDSIRHPSYEGGVT